ncbi:MAG: DUF2190 family protein [Dehalococcoidia bacterium]|nr:DUF2190 family protein [Dehalococcoidia bacterium]
MAYEKIPNEFTHAQNAGADLSAKLHYFAHVDTDGDIVLAGDGEHVLGVITEAAVENSPVTVQFGGIGKVVAGATIVAGERIASDSAGKAVPAAVGDFEVGTALTSADADDLFSFVFLPGRRHA